MFYTSIAMCQNEKNKRRIAKDKNNENGDKKPSERNMRQLLQYFVRQFSQFDHSRFFVPRPTIAKRCT